MIFRVCEHYENCHQNNDQNKDENNETIIADIKECFICFEDDTNNSFKIINLKDQLICIKNCLCNGSIHNECLKKWIDTHNSCPVCRKTVLEMNQTVFIIHRYSPFCINIYLFVKKISIRCVSFLTFLILLYMTLDYFLTTFILKLDLYEDITFDNSLNTLYSLSIHNNISNIYVVYKSFFHN